MSAWKKVMTLTEGIIIATVAAVASLGTTAIATALQGYKWRQGEQGKTQAEAAESLTNTSLVIVQQLRRDLEEVRSEMSIIKLENANLRAELTELRLTNEELRDWAERLVYQIKSLGHEPVKYKVNTLRASGQNQDVE